MSGRAELALFAHAATLPEAELDLAQAALLIAEPEYPNLDVAHYIDELDQLAARARHAISRAGSSPTHGPIASVLSLLYGELGYGGNTTDYYDPKNSFLNEVIERRRGIPISLAVLLIEVCTRASVEAEGVSFPGHFLVRTEGPRGPLLIDPFAGRILDAAELRTLHVRSSGEDHDPDPALLEPCSKSHILTRMLGNLRQIYSSIGDRPRLTGVLERLALLSPSDELRQQLDRLGGARAWRSPSRPGGRVPN